MNRQERYQGGLVFLGKHELELDGFCRIIVATLLDYGHCVESQSVQGDMNGRIVAARFSLHVALTKTVRKDQCQPGSRCRNIFGDTDFQDAQDMRLSFSLHPADPEREAKDECEHLLVVMLFRMVEAYRPNKVEWLDPKMQIETQIFLRAFNNVLPRRVRGRRQKVVPGDRFTPVTKMAKSIQDSLEAPCEMAPSQAETSPVERTAEEKLAWALRTERHLGEHEPDVYESVDGVPSGIQRLAIWGMTGVLATLSAPVALALAAVNLARGEDFRLNTQVLSLTAGVLGLQSSGMLNRAVSVLML
ncbi:MAG: hypothetical protein V2I43_06265 [Parvularcula sp.]|nr:hypothetical protein [Parvularcula sp.]